jgi:hypothetical protein
VQKLISEKEYEEAFFTACDRVIVQEGSLKHLQE